MKTRSGSKTETQTETRRADNDNGTCWDDFDDLVLRASSGDRRAVGAIGIALGNLLLEEARNVLKERDGEAEAVLRDFLLFLVEGQAPFNRANGPAMGWMRRMVRTIAQQRRRERRGDWGLQDDDD
jgi:hypothetical protein